MQAAADAPSRDNVVEGVAIYTKNFGGLPDGWEQSAIGKLNGSLVFAALRSSQSPFFSTSETGGL